MKSTQAEPVDSMGRAVPEYCQRCGERLNWKRIEWMELDSYTGLYSGDGFDFPDPDRSQGWFPFGAACAKSQIRGQTDLTESSPRPETGTGNT